MASTVILKLWDVQLLQEYYIWSHPCSNDVPHKNLMVALEEMETRELIGRMIVWILDLYLEGVVPLPNDDLIAAYLSVKSIKLTDPEMKSSFASR